MISKVIVMQRRETMAPLEVDATRLPMIVVVIELESLASCESPRQLHCPVDSLFGLTKLSCCLLLVISIRFRRPAAAAIDGGH